MMQNRFATNNCSRCNTEYISDWKLAETRTIDVFNLIYIYHEYESTCKYCGKQHLLEEREGGKLAKQNTKRKKK